MGLEEHATGVVNVTPEELRAYMREHGENDYLLLDVRQPQEYVAGHVPGAWLVPLMEVEARIDEIRRASDKLTIVYCQSGGRSARGAAFLAQAGMPNVFNLLGGMSAWSGERLPDFPKVRVFDGKGSVREVLVQAMDLEKGAERLYTELAEYFSGTAVAETIEMLAKAEQGHSHAVYGALKKLGEEQHLEDFDTLYASLEGDVLENGASFDGAVDIARSVAAQGSVALLELAVGIELQAYDLYRSLAHSATDDGLRETFVDLAEQEKRHARSLLHAIGKAVAA